MSIAITPKSTSDHAPGLAMASPRMSSPALAMIPATTAPVGVVIPPTTANTSRKIDCSGRYESPVTVRLAAP